MKIEKFNIGKLSLLCAVNQDSDEVAYIMYPVDTLHDWIVDASGRYGISIVVITGFDWDDDLTPWPAPGVPTGSPDFKGLAPVLLKTLTEDIIPEVEQRYGLQNVDLSRTLIGVSLSGLFTLWQWPQCNKFRNIATLSGSFWYEGFEQWIFNQSFSDKTGICHMLLGSDEPHSNIPVFRRVGTCTGHIAGYLRRQGVDITYDMVPGNHFQHALKRLDNAFDHLYHRIEGL